MTSGPASKREERSDDERLGTKAREFIQRGAHRGSGTDDVVNDCKALCCGASTLRNWQPVYRLEKPTFWIGPDSLREIEPDTEIECDRLGNESAAQQGTAHGRNPMARQECRKCRNLWRQRLRVEKQSVEVEPGLRMEPGLEQE